MPQTIRKKVSKKTARAEAAHSSSPNEYRKEEVQHYYQPSQLCDRNKTPLTYATMSESDLHKLENWREHYVSWMLRQPRTST